MRKVRPRDLTGDIHERMIWGENADDTHNLPHLSPHGMSNKPEDVSVVDINLDTQESLSSSGLKRRHESYPSKGRTLEERSVLPTPHSNTSPNILPSSRRRPRGSEAGKSIHKAAEAPQILQASPGSSASPKFDRHLSPSAGSRNVTPVQRREGRISVNAFPVTARKSGSTKTPQKTRSQHRKASRYSGNDSNDPPVMDHDRNEGSEHLATAHDHDRPQVARKTIRVAKSTKGNIAERSPVARKMLTKAARKFSSRYMSRDKMSVNMSGSSSEDSSDNESLSSSSESTSSNGISVKRDSGDVIDPQSFATFTSLSPNRTPPRGPSGGKSIHTNHQPEPHSHDSRLRSPLPSECILMVDSHDAEGEVISYSPSTVDRGCSEINPPGRNLKKPTKQDFSPSSQNLESYRSNRRIISLHKEGYTPASISPRVLFASGKPPYVPNTGEVTPPQPLVDAFQNLMVYPLYLHRTNRLPFLRRNVCASFRAWCRDLHIRPQLEADIPTITYPQTHLIYEYLSASGDTYTYETMHPRRECPLCSLFGVFSSWEALKKHVRWDHSEIGCDFILEDQVNSRLVVRMKEPSPLPRPVTSLKGGSSSTASTTNGPSFRVVEPVESKMTACTECPYSPSRASDKLGRSCHSSENTSTTSQKATTSNEVSVSSRRVTPDATPKPDDIRVPPPQSLTTPTASSPRLTSSTASPRSRPPTPPPKFDRHGAAHPIIADPQNPLARVQPTTYRPTGPHLYDHLSSLPLGPFGRQSWFVLDKEEEIFELIDVLDEDKVMCALWGRWILLNRSFFIGNYLAGVEAFVDEYWLIIHRAAGWGALRAWLLLLVSRRFLKNAELVQVLKKYNNLVGKEKWPES